MDVGCHGQGMGGYYEDYTRVYLSHSRESSQAVHTHSHTIHTLFAQSSHRIHSYSHTIRTLFARSVRHYSHTIRTVAHYSHTIRTVARYSHGRTLFEHFSHGRTLFARFSHYSRHLHTKFADYSHQFAPRSHYSRGGGEPVRTHSRSIRTVHTRSHL